MVSQHLDMEKVDQKTFFLVFVIASLVDLGMCWCCTILLHSDLLDKWNRVSTSDICLTFRSHSFLCSCSKIPSLTR